MFCRRPSSKLTLASPKWHALVAEVVIDMEAGDVDVVVVVAVAAAVVEVGFDVVEKKNLKKKLGSFTTS